LGGKEKKCEIGWRQKGGKKSSRNWGEGLDQREWESREIGGWWAEGLSGMVGEEVLL